MCTIFRCERVDRGHRELQRDTSSMSDVPDLETLEQEAETARGGVAERLRRSD